MSKATLDHRHRNKGGEISGKHRNTLIRTLRKVYHQTGEAGKASSYSHFHVGMIGHLLHLHLAAHT